MSHAGAGPLRETAAFSGLVAGVNTALIDTYWGPPIHTPGQVFTDLAVAVLGDRPGLFGAVASMPTAS